MTMSEPSPPIVSEQMELDGLTLSQGVSLAKTYHRRAAEQELRARVPVYGLKFAAWLASFDPDTQLWKTSGGSLLGQMMHPGDGSEEFSGTWPRSGMTRNGIAYQLPQLVPNTIGREFGLLPTPIKTDGFTIKQFSAGTQLKAELNGYQPRFWGRLVANGFTLEEVCQTYERMMGFPPRHTDLPPAETL
jgi:hypothetical protein